MGCCINDRTVDLRIFSPWTLHTWQKNTQIHCPIIDAAPKAATVTNIRRAVAGSCSFPTVQKSCQELLQKGNRKRRPKIHYFSRLSPSYAISPIAQATLELHFSVARYGGLRLSFHDITEYLRGLVSLYDRPIIVVSEY